MSPAAALAGTTDNRPKPNADTATSAMRLIDVFVDICFLSKKVEIEDFSRSAGRLRTHSSDMSAPFWVSRVATRRVRVQEGGFFNVQFTHGTGVTLVIRR